METLVLPRRQSPRLRRLRPHLHRQQRRLPPLQRLQLLRQSIAPSTPPAEPRQKTRPSRGSKERGVERKSHPGREVCRPGY